jgi:hypothetical protein
MLIGAGGGMMFLEINSLRVIFLTNYFGKSTKSYTFEQLVLLTIEWFNIL